jgi:hypothetical protein
MSTKAEFELKSALISTGLVLPVGSSSRGGYVEVLSRQVPGQEKAWLQVVKDLLLAAKAATADVHICRRYLMPEDQMVFGWHMSISTKGAKAAEELVGKLNALVFSKAKPSLTLVTAEERSGGRLAAPDPDSGGPQRRAAPAEEGSTAGGVRTVAQGRDRKGKPWEIREIPLPHVNRDLNVPNKKGRGASGYNED